MTKPYIGFDLTDRSHSIKQSICRMLNGAANYEEKSIEMYKNIHGQMVMADIDRNIIDKLTNMIDKNRTGKIIEIAKEVGCEIYYE